MRGADTLRRPAEVAEAEMALLATRTPAELISVWWRDCDCFPDGSEEREHLQEVYTEKLRKLGALHG